jgi:hypothetical protein
MIGGSIVTNSNSQNNSTLNDSLNGQSGYQYNRSQVNRAGMMYNTMYGANTVQTTATQPASLQHPIHIKIED